MPFAMTIRISEIRTAIVEGRRQIDPLVGVETIQKIAVVDAVGVFLDKGENAGGFRYIAHTDKLAVMGIVRIHRALHDLSGVAQHRVHRHAAHTLLPAGLPLNLAEGNVRRTFENLGYAADIRTQATDRQEERVRIL